MGKFGDPSVESKSLVIISPSSSKMLFLLFLSLSKEKTFLLLLFQKMLKNNKKVYSGACE
jgi:hypothetical protein